MVSPPVSPLVMGPTPTLAMGPGPQTVGLEVVQGDGLGLGIGEGRREGRWVHGEDVLPRLVGPVAGVLVDGHRGLPQGIEGARHPRLPLPQGLAHQGLHLGPWPLRGWRRGDTARPCPPLGLPSPGAGRERSLSLSPKRGWDGWHSRWPAGPEPAPGAERDVFAWGTTLRNHGLTPGNSIIRRETWPPRRGPSGFQIEVLLSITSKRGDL